MKDELIGARLGNYEIQSALGQGGMARVYRAWDVTLKRPVALKVVEPTLSLQDRYRERFEREAEAVAALEHPNIVPVYYFGKTDTLYFLVMKFIEGEDLNVLMNRYALAGEYLPVSDMLRVIDGVVSAVDYAHSKGVIHRDIKPSNIMIDSTGHPYLADFGLALNLTQGTLGDVLGTPHYVSPEQARNSADAVPQSDLYSLGIMLYELFTGVVPFDDPSPTAVALQHLMNEPLKPRALNPEISPQVEAMILKAMAKKPQDRYQSGQELAAALRAALQNAATPREVAEIPALPPLPPGFQPPAPRRMSTRPVAAEVRASLAQRIPAEVSSSQKATMSVGKQPRSFAPTTTGGSARGKQGGSYLPLVVLGGVILAVLVIVGIVASSLNNSPQTVGVLATATSEATTNPNSSTQSAVIPATVTPAVLPTEMPSTSGSEQPTAAPALPTQTPVPPTDALEQPSATPIPPTQTPLLPTSIPSATIVVAAFPTVPSGPTAPPAGWLPVRFLYNADAFYWMNDSDRVIRAEHIVFERIGGTEHFEGNRMAYYSMEAGRCMQIMFADVASQGCPEGRRPNALFTPSRTQGVDFWTGDSGQFRVLWRDVEVAVCDIAAGQCSAFLPLE